MAKATPDQLVKVAEGREAEMFAWGDGAILRLMRNPDAQARVEWQRDAIEAARSCGVRVPAVYETVTVDGRPGLVMERIEGVDLLTLVGRQPWQFARVFSLEARIHAELHAAKAPASLRGLRESVALGIERRSGLPEDLLKFALDVLTSLPDAETLCHGDFHPGNIILAADGPVIIDWSNAVRGDPAADVARSWLMHRFGELPPGTPFVLYPLAAAGRGLGAFLYLRGYRKRRPIDSAHLRRWEVVMAAHRLTEGIESERSALERLLERRRRRGV